MKNMALIQFIMYMCVIMIGKIGLWAANKTGPMCMGWMNGKFIKLSVISIGCMCIMGYMMYDMKPLMNKYRPPPPAPRYEVYNEEWMPREQE